MAWRCRFITEYPTQVNAFPKRPGANFIPLTPLAFIDRARHVSRVLHVFGLPLCRRSRPPADGAKLSPRRWREVHRNPTG